MRTFCVTDGITIAEGDYSSIVYEVFDWKIDGNTLYAKTKLAKEYRQLHGYVRDQWTDAEIIKDVLIELFKKLPSFGYRIYESYG